MDKNVIIVVALILTDVVVNIACCLLGKKQAKVDKDLTEALLSNRDAVLKRNEVLEFEVKSLKTLIEMISQKQDREKEAKKDGKDEGEGESKL